jgi:dihydroorotase
MPNTDPPLDRPERLKDLLRIVNRDAACHVYPMAAAVVDRDATRLSDFAALKEAGAVAVSDDAMPLQDTKVMAHALAAAGEAAIPLVIHPELFSAASCGVVSDAAIAQRLGVPYASAAREAESLLAWREAAARTRTLSPPSLHVAHLSSASAIDAFRELSREPLLKQATAETCPHYFTLTAEAVLKHGANAKMNPPLRTARDVEAVRTALADGTISVIATDHAPHTPQEKATPLAQAPSGIVGLETAVGIVLTYLVRPGVLPLSEAIAKLTWRPAQALCLPCGQLTIGSRADITLLDLEASWQVNPDQFVSKSRNTPFAAWELRGRAVMTFVSGKCVMTHGQVLV